MSNEETVRKVVNGLISTTDTFVSPSACEYIAKRLTNDIVPHFLISEVEESYLGVFMNIGDGFGKSETCYEFLVRSDTQSIKLYVMRFDEGKVQGNIPFEKEFPSGRLPYWNFHEFTDALEINDLANPKYHLPGFELDNRQTAEYIKMAVVYPWLGNIMENNLPLMKKILKSISYDFNRRKTVKKKLFRIFKPGNTFKECCVLPEGLSRATDNIDTLDEMRTIISKYDISNVNLARFVSFRLKPKDIKNFKWLLNRNEYGDTFKKQSPYKHLYDANKLIEYINSAGPKQGLTPEVTIELLRTLITQQSKKYGYPLCAYSPDLQKNISIMSMENCSYCQDDKDLSYLECQYNEYPHYTYYLKELNNPAASKLCTEENAIGPYLFKYSNAMVFCRSSKDESDDVLHVGALIEILPGDYISVYQLGNFADEDENFKEILCKWAAVYLRRTELEELGIEEF